MPRNRSKKSRKYLITHNIHLPSLTQSSPSSPQNPVSLPESPLHTQTPPPTQTQHNIPSPHQINPIQSPSQPRCRSIYHPPALHSFDLCKSHHIYIINVNHHVATSYLDATYVVCTEERSRYDDKMSEISFCVWVVVLGRCDFGFEGIGGLED